MSEKTKVNYKELYHELLEKSDEVFNENGLLKAANDSAKKEIATLRQTIGGYITQAAKAKKEIAELRSDYEAAKKSINDLTKVSLENKAMVKGCITKAQELEEAHCQEINDWKRKVATLENELSIQRALTDKVERSAKFYKENYDYFIKLPWYKRLFVK